MTTYLGVMLTDTNLNRVSSIPYAYYDKGGHSGWSGCIYNNTASIINNCKLITTNTFDGVFSITGGDVVEYTPITSDWDTTCNIGTVESGETVAVSIKLFIASESALDGMLLAPILISK